MVNFEENYHFSRFQRGSNIFQGGGGSNFFQGGGGSNCLFHIEAHISCDFQGGGGSGAPVPPLDPHLPPLQNKKKIGFFANTGFDPLKIYEAAMPAFNFGSSFGSQRNDIFLLVGQ